MAQEKGRKLNRLLKHWPRGAVYSSSWLRDQGIRFDLLDHYRRSDWLSSVGHGAVARSGDSIDWTGGLYAIQHQLNLQVHPGGRTALEFSGYGHFLPLASRRVCLFGEPGQRLPKWFRDHKWTQPVEYITTNLFAEKAALGLEEKSQGDFSLQVASPERAILEVCYLVPRLHAFEEAGLLMEGLVSLRPSLTQKLLEKCGSIKAKRIFLFLADHCQHSWRGRLDLSKVDLGSGKRDLVEGGKLDPEYKITVPPEFVEAS